MANKTRLLRMWKQGKIDGEEIDSTIAAPGGTFAARSHTEADGTVTEHLYYTVDGTEVHIGKLN